MKSFLTIIFLLSAALVSAQDSEFHLDKTYSINTNGTINLRSSDANVHIKGTSRKDVHVKIDRTVEITGATWGDNDFEVKVTEENGDLNIIERNEGDITIVGSISEKYQIWIEAPVGVSLNIKGDDDDYFIENINGSVTLDADDSDARFVNCQGNEFNFDIDDGDITMDKAAGKLQIDADDADVRIKNASFTYIHADIDDGDIFIETSIADNGEYEFSGDDSSFELLVTAGGGHFNIYHDDGSTRTSEAYEIIEKDEDKSIFKLRNGKARLNFNTDDASIRLSSL